MRRVYQGGPCNCEYMTAIEDNKGPKYIVDTYILPQCCQYIAVIEGNKGSKYMVNISAQYCEYMTAIEVNKGPKYIVSGSSFEGKVCSAQVCHKRVTRLHKSRQDQKLEPLYMDSKSATNGGRRR